MWKYFARLEQRHQVLFAIAIGFSVVAFWRGIWGLLDIFLLPENELWSFIISTCIGLIILFLSGVLMRVLAEPI